LIIFKDEAYDNGKLQRQLQRYQPIITVLLFGYQFDCLGIRQRILKRIGRCHVTVKNMMYGYYFLTNPMQADQTCFMTINQNSAYLMGFLGLLMKCGKLGNGVDFEKRIATI